MIPSSNQNFKYELLIRESHLDTFGHVNNATYLQLYEEARWELISSRGYGLDKIQSTQHGPVILEAQLKFFKELQLRQKIFISIEMLDYSKKIGRIKQQMILEDQSIASEVILIFGLFDLKTRKLIEPTKDWMQALGMV